MRRALGELAMEDGMSEAIAWAARAEALLCDAASGRPDVTERLQLLPPPPPAPSMAAGAGATDAAARRLAIAERALVGAVNATHYGLGREIAAASGFDRIDPADPGQEPMTVTRRDLLFCLGVLELQPGGDPARALALMQRVRMLMQPGEGQDDVADLFWAALRGELHAMLRIDGAEAAEAHHRGLLAGVAMASAPWDLRLGDLRLGDLRLRDPVL
jgi:hypothetical protein